MTIEQQILECRIQDAQSHKAVLASVWRASTEAHNPDNDAIERAQLACERRDAAEIRGWFASIVHFIANILHGRHGGAAQV